MPEETSLEVFVGFEGSTVVFDLKNWNKAMAPIHPAIANNVIIKYFLPKKSKYPIGRKVANKYISRPNIKKTITGGTFNFILRLN